MKEVNYIIYGLKAKNTEEIKYIGLTTQKLKIRFNGHLSDQKINYKTNQIKKTGKENIEIIIIEENISDFKLLCEKEIYYIAKYKEEGHKLTNITNGGEGFFGMKLTQEHKDKISLNHANVSGNKNPMYGKTHTDKVKKILKDYHTGRTATLETKIKMSENKIGEKNNKAKLTKENVLEIRSLYETNNYTYDNLALLFNVKKAAIHKIITKINQKHI